jgi:AcrR family transcriptional regulator
VSLRERNRIETTRAIHRAAYDLVMDHGLSQTTVEAIASQAGVSKRTFFNYFATKEDAVLGSTDPVLDEEAVRAFREDDADLLIRTIRLLLSVLESAFGGGSTLAQRRELLERFPELRRPFMRQLSAVERLVRSALEERLSEEDPDNPVLAGLPAVPDAPKALLALAGAVVRFTAERQIEQGHPISTLDLSAAVEDSIHIFREVFAALR